jgi:hypothetical protein
MRSTGSAANRAPGTIRRLSAARLWAMDLKSGQRKGPDLH